MKVNGGRIIIDFDNFAGGLVVKDGGELKHFVIAGKNRGFSPAKAEIKGNQVIVWSGRLDNPVAVRYAWAQNPEGGLLFNKIGLHASPFRTDTWRLRTDCQE